MPVAAAEWGKYMLGCDPSVLVLGRNTLLVQRLPWRIRLSELPDDRPARVGLRDARNGMSD